MVNPLHVKRSKELDDNLQTKNDKKDAVVIARLMKDGRFSVDVATQSIGLTEGSQMARFEIATLIRQYRLLEEEIEVVNCHLAELAKSTEEYVYLSSVTG